MIDKVKHAGQMPDLRRLDVDKTWIVIGWFTPDYRHLAEKLAANLDAEGAPYHMLAKPKLGDGWDTRRKPSVVLEAMDFYPDKTLVLMDVDCIVQGDIAPATEIHADVGLSVKARQARKGWAWRKPIVVTLSSRVVVFRPTKKAREFAREWNCLCMRAKAGGDEISMAWAYIKRPDISYQQLDQRYAGREINVRRSADRIMIWHDSAHDTGRWGIVRGALKSIERRLLRTGRTKAAAQQELG